LIRAIFSRLHQVALPLPWRNEQCLPIIVARSQ
jgi:hypothetical protein